MVETSYKMMKKEEIFDDVASFVLLEREEGKLRPWYLKDLLGKPVFEWVTRVCPTIPVSLEIMRGDSVLTTIKPYLKDREFTLVLFGSTPMLSKTNVAKIISYMRESDFNVLALPKGYVFRTDYIKRVDDVYATQTYPYFSEEFFEVDSVAAFNEVFSTLKEKILDFHQTNGVEFIDRSQVYIESEVRIGAGVVVYPFVTLAGQTQVYNNVIIGAGSKIENSKIGDCCQISGASVYSSTVKDNSIISDGVVIEKGSFIGAGAFIAPNAVITNSSVAPKGQIGESALINCAKIYSGALISPHCIITGSEANPVKIAENKVVNSFEIIKNN